MVTFIYRSPKKAEMYLYLVERDNFDKCPEELLKAFGEPEFSMAVNLDNRDKLAREDIGLVRKSLEEKGYYLQMPPSILDDQNHLKLDK
jgi:uncharacterized protein